MSRLYTEIWGERQKQTVLLLHGSFTTDPIAPWTQQRALADHYRVMIPHRPGYGRSQALSSEEQAGAASLAAEAQAIADLLEAKSHIVGFSYGGLVALALAADHPEFVSSLAVIEPPLYGLLRGDPAAEDLIRKLQPVYAAARRLSPEEFYYAFLQGLGQKADPAVPLSPERRQAALAAATEVPPWNVELPLTMLAAAPFPKLVLSGSWNLLNERVCDTLARNIAAMREVIPGAGHGVQRTGQPFNKRIELLWQQATSNRYEDGC